MTIDAPPELVVTFDDCRKVGFCVDGVRLWFAETGGDFRAFVKHGIRIVQLEALRPVPDAMMLRAINAAKERSHGRG